uniref:Cnd1 domain-containing protein n=1 Tax=Heterorhabditis bacteriophora TaxID=37862 RepID=A0A1I7WLJ5_HETBA
MRFDCENVQWFSVMQAALSVYFEIAKDTCIVVGRLVSKALWYTRRISDIFLFYDNKVKMNDNTGEVIKERRLYWMRAWICVTERMLAFSGEVAMRCVIHTDVTYVKEVKRMAEVIAYTAKGEIVPEEAPNRTLKEWEWRSAMHKGIFDFSDADKLGITGVSEEERIRSRSTAILDSKLLRQGRLLSRLLPFVVYCLRAESSSPRIRNAAALAFSKFILISRDMAERGSMLFFSLLNNSPYPMVRNNMMVAAADFSFRFPNTVEKYAQDVYAMLEFLLLSDLTLSSSQLFSAQV